MHPCSSVPHIVTPHRADIDGLRAIAVLAVVAFHAFPNSVRGGFIGVDIFFVISGYLISSIILSDLEDGRFSFFEFYARRIRRIFPALLTILIACLAFGWFALLADEYKQLGMHVVGGTGFVSNFLLWHESGYFDNSSETKPLLHLWSLAIEEQFYIVWPLLLYAAWKFRFNRLVLIAIALVASFSYNVFIVKSNSVNAFYSPASRIWELLSGCLLAFFSIQKQIRKQHLTPNAKAFFGIVLLIVAVFTLTKESLFPGWWALLPTIGAVFLISAGRNAWVNRKVLSNRILVWFGLISFPLYLWHWPILSFAHIVESGTPSIMLRWGAVVLSIVLAWLTYKVIETPIRFGRYRNTAVVLLGGLMVAVGYLGFNTCQHDGHPSRVQAFVAKHEQYLKDINNFEAYRASFPRCQIDGKNLSELTWCVQSKNALPTKAIWGDSHADHLFPGVANTDPQTSWLLIGHTSCAPLDGVKSYRKGERDDVCLSRNKAMLEALINTKSIDTVVLSALAPYYFSDTSMAAEHTGEYIAKNWYLRIPGNSESGISKEDVFLIGLESTVEKLLKAGKQVILYKDIPELPFMPKACSGRPLTISRKTCSQPIDNVAERQERYSRILAKVAEKYPSVRIFDAPSYLCWQAKCFVGNDKVLFYRDSHHLSLSGSDFLAKPFLSWLQ